ncbi:hypothetical protein [Taibaiella chishuiensis]|uniref:Uncharacterized protein n=1 Tax=Taibaiella chishuiensis TaxID=1434707 RepID=A0A2P8CSN8_9BACT|nr:hypothetical protein [Taibaiella chishuiensis]PSK87976.1 hypothetical protein B0I18_1166 [Taibaiella chishuiensis]
MKTILLLFHFVFIAIQVKAQQITTGQATPQQRLRFSVLVNPGLPYFLEDSSAFVSGNTAIYQSREYDQSYRCPRYTYDSLSAGRYTFYTRDFWGHVRTCNIALQHDTTILLPADYYEQVNTIPLEVLKDADSIQLLYRATGCFLLRTEKLTLLKTRRGKSYTVIRTLVEPGKTDRIFHVPASIITDLHHTLSAMDKTPAGEISTTQKSIWILAGNKLFHYHDPANKWKGYDAFTGRWLQRKKQ